jgi:hypothetical protein
MVQPAGFGSHGQPEGRNYEHMGSEFIQENQAYVVGEHEYVHSDLQEGGPFRPEFEGGGQPSEDGAGSGSREAPQSGGEDASAGEVLEAPPIAANFVDQSLGMGPAPPIVIPRYVDGAASMEIEANGRGAALEAQMVAPPIVSPAQAGNRVEHQNPDEAPPIANGGDTIKRRGL